MSRPFSVFVVLCSAAAARGTECDLVLKGGHVIDPANAIDAVRDVGITDGRIARIAAAIPAEEARETIDVSGYYVTPGLIDMHVHVAYTLATSNVRSVIPDDHSFPSGVTTMVDAGTSGADHFEDFLKSLRGGLFPTRTRVFAMLNISSESMGEGEQDPRTFDIDRAVAMAKKHADTIVGFKTAHYWTQRPYDDVHVPWASVDAALEAGRRAGLPVMFDFMPRPASGGYAERSYRELILKKMRPGDIHTHCYAAHIPSLCEDGTVNPDVLEAQKRGVLFDLGHGAGSFVWKHAAPAVQQGYLPNTISTDLHGNNTASGKVVSQINVMSKMLSLGLSLEQVVRRSTVHAAEAIRRPELGRLSVGSPADIAVIRVTQGDVGYVDTSGGKFIGRRRMECAMTVFAGRVVFDPHGMSVPLWQDIPRGSKYYRPPRQPW